MSRIYSDWFKVDLHIHTDFSNRTKQNDYDGQFNINTLKTKLLENDVRLFSLTDHNIINTSAYESYYDALVEEDPILLIGCEFDIKVRQDDSTFLTYHTLLIFDENTTEKAHELSQIIEQHFTDKNIDTKERCLTEDEVFELFHPYHFFYIPHAGGHKNIVDAYKGTDIKKAQEMVLLMECAHEKVKEKHRLRHQAEFDKLKDPDFRNKQDEAFINFSDNHNCDIYPTPKNGAPHEFYCLKGEPTFETLRFAFIDPQSRIRKQQDVDLLKNVKKHIATIAIKGIETVDDIELEFSPNLNVIIGGASSGKSLLFNLLGSKIENNKHGFEKYRKDNNSVLIKPSNGHIPQQTLPFNGDEVIYINQGDIVKYFEKGDLKELVNDSGKEEELLNAKEKLQNQKMGLITELESFKNRFDRFNSVYHKDFIIYEGDFDNMLNDKYHFNEFKSSNTLIKFEEKEKLLSDISININGFSSDEIFEITEVEIKTIEQFKKLIQQKQQLIRRKKLVQESIENFIENVDRIIEEKNSTLESSSRAKKEAFKRKNTLTTTCSSLFKEAMDFNSSCNTIEDYKCEEKEEIHVGETVTLVLEIENDTHLKEAVINCINFGNLDKTVYENYLTLVVNNSNLKDYPKYTDQRLIQKLKRESEGILNKFDSPNTYLDYKGNGNSKNKSPGFNSEMYLKTILQQDKCKLVMIDQPEDNLGNTFKNEDLINLLREYKFTKQIILVTHNPSIVVYGDAESIILAENDKGQISYKQLVLEKKKYQKQIIDNLDGGKSIFNMRSRKYNVKKLLNS
ncbi:PHP domain-containing protein [Cyclobacterium amurskyense]|uniref:Polymerase/histidinol phosphatase N-terminal domain-containing protein n=1 Tax=Cyclobacterium amurskyense TaxID=320787 RepID=A0A0H4PDL2_9BACT|nr:PHP domain-containing protein [Cyclobacterium amurskyense]AKP50918.1 hypothetical protein CA2015_1480 [Cyclobacterium amurskyense]